MKLITCSFAGERPAGAPEGGGDPRLHWHARSHRRLSATAVALLPRAQDACTAPPGSTGGRGRRWELMRRARVRVGGAARAGVATVLRRTCSPAMWRRMRGTCTQATHRALLSCRVVWMCSPGYGTLSLRVVSQEPKKAGPCRWKPPIFGSSLLLVMLIAGTTPFWGGSCDQCTRVSAE